jgi:hypothetical protein
VCVYAQRELLEDQLEEQMTVAEVRHWMIELPASLESVHPVVPTGAAAAG